MVEAFEAGVSILVGTSEQEAGHEDAAVERDHPRRALMTYARSLVRPGKSAAN